MRLSRFPLPMPLPMLIVATVVIATQWQLVGTTTTGTALHKTILATDCTGGLHLLPDTPLAVSIHEPGHVEFFDAFVSRVVSRVKCQCPNVTDDLLELRYHPFGALLNALSNGSNVVDHEDSCLDGAETYTRSLADLLHLYSGVAVSLPSSCTAKRWVEEKKCAFSIDSTSSFGFTLKVAVTKCPNRSYPALSVHCAGPACSTFTPCTADSDCDVSGEGLATCADFSYFLNTPQGKGQLEYWMAHSFIFELDAITGRPKVGKFGVDEIVESFMGKIAKMFPGGKAQPKGVLKACLPTNYTDIVQTISRYAATPANSTDPRQEQDSNTDTPMFGGLVNSSIITDSCGMPQMYFELPVSSWDGDTGSMSAHDEWRLSGTAYSQMADLPMGEKESYVAGLGCGGEFRLLPSTPIGRSIQIHNLHEIIQAVAGPIRQVWAERGLEDKFAASMEMWRPEPYLTALLADDDGKIHPEKIFNLSFSGALFGWHGMWRGDAGIPQRHHQHPLRRVANAAAEVTEGTATRALAWIKAKIFPPGSEARQTDASPSWYEGMAEVASNIHAAYTKTRKGAAQYLSGQTAGMGKQRGAQTAAAYGWAKRTYQGPSTCTLSKWKTDGQCGVAVNQTIAFLPAGSVRLLLQNCPAIPDAPPAAHALCRGEMCQTLEMLGMSHECGSCGLGFVCHPIVPADVREDPLGAYLFSVLPGPRDGPQGPSSARCSALMKSIAVGEAKPGVCSSGALALADARQLYGALTRSEAIKKGSGALKVCIPSENFLAGVGETEPVLIGQPTKLSKLTEFNSMPDAHTDLTLRVSGELTEARAQSIKQQASRLAGGHPNNIVLSGADGQVIGGGKFSMQDTVVTAGIYGLPNTEASARAVVEQAAALDGVVEVRIATEPPTRGGEKVDEATDEAGEKRKFVLMMAVIAAVALLLIVIVIVGGILFAKKHKHATKELVKTVSRKMTMPHQSFRMARQQSYSKHTEQHHDDHDHDDHDDH